MNNGELPTKEEIAGAILKYLEQQAWSSGLVQHMVYAHMGVPEQVLAPEYLAAVVKWMQVRMEQDDYSAIIERLDRIEQRMGGAEADELRRLNLSPDKLERMMEDAHAGLMRMQEVGAPQDELTRQYQAYLTILDEWYRVKREAGQHAADS